MGEAATLPSTLDILDEWLQSIPDRQRIDYEIRKLRAIQTWALDHIGVDFAEGDTVEFVKAPNTDNGWRIYAEALHVGAKAQVRQIDFNCAYGFWFAEIVLEREWSVTDYQGGTRWWHGPASETPEGMKPPHDPEGRKGVFCMPVQYLRLAENNTSEPQP